jgi:hypothetical protein
MAKLNLKYESLDAAIKSLERAIIVFEKIKQNSQKYPVEKSKGTAKKYNEI